MEARDTRPLQHTVYRTVNLLNGRFYLGLHSTRNPDDGYLGSGTAILAAVKKYGRNSFKKEVLAVFDSESEMIALESHIIDSANLANPLCYNMTPGGGKPPVLSGDLSPMRKPEIAAKNALRRTGAKRNEEAKLKMRMRKLGKPRVLTDQGRIKMAENLMKARAAYRAQCQQPQVEAS